MALKKVIVASKNPVKIEASRIGFEKMIPDEGFSFEGISVPSGVSDQPMSNHETMEGAINRASNAKTQNPDADYWIGIEGGIEKIGNEMEAFAWVAVHSNSQSGKSRTSTFYLPQKVVELIDQGMELGQADDVVFGHSNSKQKNGAVGILTGDVIDRAGYYAEAVVLALIPFRNEELY